MNPLVAILRSAHENLLHNIECRATYSIAGRFCVDHLSPPAFEALERKLLQVASSSSEAPPSTVNERPFGIARVAFDIDTSAPHSLEQEELYELSARELARLVTETLEMEFGVTTRSSVVVLRSGKFRYRILTQVLYFNFCPQAALLLWRLVKLKAKARSMPILEKMCGEWFDKGPLLQSHLRMHGTTNTTGDIDSVYKVSYVQPSSKGDLFDTTYVTIFPSTSELLFLMQSPRHPEAYLRGWTAFAYHIAGAEFAEKPLVSPLWHSTDVMLEAAFAMRNGAVRVTLVVRNVALMQYYYNENDHCVVDERLCRVSYALAMVRTYPNDETAFITYYCNCCKRWSVHQAGHPNMFMRPAREDIADAEFAERHSAANHCDVVTAVHKPTERFGAQRFAESVTVSDLQEPLICEVYPRGLVRPVDNAAVLTSPVDERDFRMTAVKFGVREMAVNAAKRASMPFSQREISAITEIGHFRESNQGIDLAVDPSGKSRVSIAFRDVEVLHLPRFAQPVPLSLITIAAPCDSGKTFWLVEMAKRVRSIFAASFRVLLVGPRIALVAKLAADFGLGLDVVPWTYSNRGSCPRDSVVCGTTLDSLTRAIRDSSGAVQHFTMVVIDEIETSMRHMAGSATLSRAPDLRMQLFTALDTVCSNANYVFYADKDMHSLSRRFLSLPILKLKEQARQAGTDMRAVSVTHLKLMDGIQVTEYATETYQELVQGMINSLEQGERIIVFEPYPEKAQVLAEFLKRVCGLPDGAVLVITGDTSALQKRNFSSDPVRALENIRVLIHTTAIGVGISIEGEVFHKRFLIYRGSLFMDQVSQQALVRARSVIGDLANQRSVYVWYEKRVGKRLLPLYQRETLATALANANWLLATQRQQHIALNGAMRSDPATGRLSIDVNNPYAVFIVHALASEKLALEVQSHVIQHRQVDSGAHVIAANIQVNRQELLDEMRTDVTNARDRRMQMQVLHETDERMEAEAKLNALTELGISLDSPLVLSPLFMSGVHKGFSPGSVKRLHGLIESFEHGEAEVPLQDSQRLDGDVETAPGHANDDRRGIVTYECFVVRNILMAAGLHPARLLNDQTRFLILNEQFNIVNAVDEEYGVLLGAWLPRAASRLQLLNRQRYSHLHGWKTNLQLARRIVNGYFGDHYVAPERMGGTFDRARFRLAYALVPAFARSRGIAVSPEVEEILRPLSGEWDAVIRSEQLN